MEQSTEIRDVIMTLDELVAACEQDRGWVVALIEENIIKPDVSEPTASGVVQQFSGYQLTLARRASRLSRDFDASVPAIGLILELLDELEQLRQFKRQWQAQTNTHIIEIEVD